MQGHKQKTFLRRNPQKVQLILLTHPRGALPFDLMRNIFLLVILIGLALSPCLKAGFVYWDDDLHLLDNPQTKTLSLSNTVSIFQSVVNKTYIPLTILSFNIEHAIFGLDPFVYHLNNLLLHILACLLIYQLLCRMGLGSMTAFFAALLFGIHPLHVESVAWITERKDVLYTLFYLLGLIQYSRYIETGHKKAWALCVCAGFLSLLAKPMALSYPLILMLFDWFFKRKWGLRIFLEKAPFIFFVPIVWLTYSLNIKANDHPFLESLLIWLWSFSFYLEKFFFPAVLTPLYALPYPISITNPQYLITLSVGLAAVLAVLFYRKDRLLVFAAFYYLLSIFFLLRTSDVTRNLGPSIVADRFMYLPSLGICLWLAHKASEQLKKGSFVFRPLIAVLIALLAFQTFQQCRIWHDDHSLWKHQLKHEQRVPLAYNSYAVALSKMKDDAGALEALDQAIKLKPDYARAYYNRGHIYIRLGKYEAALNDLGSAIMHNPTHYKSFLDRATTYSRLGRYTEALKDLNTAAGLEPNNFEVYNNRGIVHKKLGQLQNALEDLNHALEFNPRSSSTYINRAKLFEEMGKQAEALNDIKEAERVGISK